MHPIYSSQYSVIHRQFHMNTCVPLFYKSLYCLCVLSLIVIYLLPNNALLLIIYSNYYRSTTFSFIRECFNFLWVFTYHKHTYYLYT